MKIFINLIAHCNLFKASQAAAKGSAALPLCLSAMQ